MRSQIARSIAVKFLLATLLVVAPSSVLRAHEGHDHGAPPPPVSSTIAPRIDASSADFELVAIARGTQMTIYLDTFKGNVPIANADIEVDAPGGVLKGTATQDEGVYTVVAPFLAIPGSYDLAITVSSAGMVDVLTATFKVPDPNGGPPMPSGSATSWIMNTALAEDLKQRVAGSDMSLLAAGAIGFIIGAALILVVRRRRGGMALVLLPAALAVMLADPALAGGALGSPAPILAPSASAVVSRDVSQRFADGTLFVPKPTQRILGLRTLFTEAMAHRRSIELPGRVVPDPNASGLVQASGGGRLAPPPGGFKPLGTAIKAGDILAFVQPPLPTADATSQQQEARLLDQQISLVTRKVERFKLIERVIARSQLEDAELELKGLNERRANLARANREPEPLTAPVNGVIAAANAVAGQVVEPNTIVFQIVDPGRLWIEALTFEPQATTGRAQGVLVGGRTLDLSYLGTGLADRNQAVPVHFSVKGDTSGLRAGQFVTVLAATQEERRGIALPREAVLRGSNGQSIVYEHTNAERFVVREVRVEPLDGARVLVISGVDPGKRIVTQGAELLNQIR